eukprot:11066291-Alexandrium_andersonii.AAC.1
MSLSSNWSRAPPQTDRWRRVLLLAVPSKSVGVEWVAAHGQQHFTSSFRLRGMHTALQKRRSRGLQGAERGQRAAALEALVARNCGKRTASCMKVRRNKNNKTL